MSEAYLELCQTCKMECFVKIVYDFAKLPILNVWQGSEYASAYERRENELELVENFKDTKPQETKRNKNWKRIILKKINSKKVYLWNQYYYFDLMEIMVALARITKN